MGFREYNNKVSIDSNAGMHLSAVVTDVYKPVSNVLRTVCEEVLQLLLIIVIVIVISKLLKRYSKVKRTRAPAYSRAPRRIKGGFPKGVKRSSGPISKVPGGDRVAVRVGVVEMGRGNDQKGQGRRD